MIWMEAVIVLGAISCCGAIALLGRGSRRWWALVMVALLAAFSVWAVHDRQGAAVAAHVHHQRHCAQQGRGLERFAEDVERERVTRLHDLGFTMRTTSAYHVASVFCAKSYSRCNDWLNRVTLTSDERTPEELAHALRTVADAIRSGVDCPQIESRPLP